MDVAMVITLANKQAQALFIVIETIWSAVTI